MAEFIEWPLGKLDEETSTRCGTTEGRARSNPSFSSGFKSAPPPTETAPAETAPAETAPAEVAA